MRSWIEIKRDLEILSKELTEKAYTCKSIKCTEKLYDASEYVDEAVRKINEAVERREVESKVYE